MVRSSRGAIGRGSEGQSEQKQTIFSGVEEGVIISQKNVRFHESKTHKGDMGKKECLDGGGV